MKLRNSLYAKMSLGLVFILLLVGVIYTLSVTVLSTRLQQQTIQSLNRNLAKNLVDDKRLVRAGAIDTTAMSQTFNEYMTINPSIEIYHLDLSGKILSYSAEPGKVKRNHVDLKPIKQFLSGNSMLPLLGDDPRSHDRRKTFSVTSLPDAKKPTGYLYVVLQGEELSNAREAISQQYLLTLAVPSLAGSLILGLLIGLLIFRRLTLRLRDLQDKVTAFADGGYQRLIDIDSKLEINKGDEITDLEIQFQQMGKRLSEQWVALKQQDTLRREMVANISHDLRTPLASAQGYLETIELKDDVLSEEDKKQYLSIAIQQTQRLQKLIDQLFELVKLEARNVDISFEKFSILELEYDVVNKFKLKANDKNIQLLVDENAQDQLVVADIGLIERVLDNLIDNAMQYTPENRKVWLNVSTIEQNQVCVSVADEGKGITNEQKELIFQRFHRADNPQRTSTGHAGLGLSIVKKIIELHHENIWVESESGKGARFLFTLPLAD